MNEVQHTIEHFNVTIGTIAGEVHLHLSAGEVEEMEEAYCNSLTNSAQGYSYLNPDGTKTWISFANVGYIKVVPLPFVRQY